MKLIEFLPVLIVLRAAFVGSVSHTVSMRGYSYSGGGRGIVRVDVSADNGHNWRTATLTEQPLNRAWAWTFWKVSDLVRYILLPWVLLLVYCWYSPFTFEQKSP